MEEEVWSMKEGRWNMEKWNHCPKEITNE